MLVLPRLDRESALEILRTHLDATSDVIAAHMPDTTPVVTYTPVGGTRIEERQLVQLRLQMVGLAQEYGMPGRVVTPSEFEGRAARLLHNLLPMSPNEASYEEVWSYLTCCWLLDVAAWRFGNGADERRFIGNVNRNTFRRLWWRAEILGSEIDLTQMGEDELVNIMERPTIASDRRLARTVAGEFLARVDRGAAESRMQLMREAMKRLLRLTPLVAFAALRNDEVQQVVEHCFNAAAAGLAGEPADPGGRHRVSQGPDGADRQPVLPPVSAGVTAIERMTMTEDEPTQGRLNGAVTPDFEDVTQTALEIARRSGRVTNTNLREIVPITSGEAREVLQSLVNDGLLARRGVRRGTYYILADSDDTGESVPTAQPSDPNDPANPDGGTALRRLLRRGG
jgi:hypothetical protein